MPKKKEVNEAGVPDEVVSSLVKQLNKGHKSAYSFFEREDPSEIKQWISTGSTLLDYAISNRRDGGIPYGRITEINGLESSGKSLLSLHIIANAQKKGGMGVILDTEERLLDKAFLLRVGIDPRKLVINNPGSIEECFESIEDTVAFVRKTESKKERPIVIVWDSLAVTPPKAELEGTYDPQSQMGLGAKAVARGIRKLTHTIGTENIALVIINQLKMNTKMANIYSDPYITPYGKALPYASSVRLRVTQGKKLKDSNEEIVGTLCNVKVIKNSLGPPNRQVTFPLIFGYGVDNLQSIYDYLKDKGSIKKASGTSKFSAGEFQGEFPHEKWKSYFADNQGVILDHLEQLLVKRYEDINPEHELDLTVDSSEVSSEV